MKLRSLLAAALVAILSFGASAEGISFEHISLEAALKRRKQRTSLFLSTCMPRGVALVNTSRMKSLSMEIWAPT